MQFLPVLRRIIRGLVLMLLATGMIYAGAISLLLTSFTDWAGIPGLFILLLGLRKAWGNKPIGFLLATLLVWGITNLVLIRHSLATYNSEKARYTAIVHQGGHLTLREKSNIYVLNILMSLTALPVYPEVAKESLYLIIPSRNRTRHFEGDFFLSSAVVQKKISNLQPGESRKIYWSGKDYLLHHQEARYALALNPCRLTLTSTGNTLRYEARVRVDYPASCEAEVISWPIRIAVEEGLFHYLEQCGWLHPYEAVWFTEMPMVKKRLQDQ